MDITEFYKRLGVVLKGRTNLYVLDLSWHLHRNYNTFREFYVDIDGYHRPTGHLYGVLSTVKMILETDPGAAIVITQDGVPQERIDEMASSGSEYKEGRPELEFNFYADIPTIKAATCYLPQVYWAYNSDKECDDLMYALSRHAQKVKDFTGRIFVYSGDNDLLQSIDDRTSVIRSKSNRGFDEIDSERVKTDEKFTKKFHGVDPAHITNFRAICGDASDKIKGIERFPRDIAVKVAMSTDSIMNGWTYCPQNDKEKKWLNRLDEEIETVRRNYKLMKLPDDIVVNISKPKVNRESLLTILDKFELQSYKRFIEGGNYE